MDIRELLKKTFNEDLPIRGGMGNSLKEAVILEPAGPINDYVALEYRVMDLISTGRDVSWELQRQELIVNNGRQYDKLIVAVKGINGNPMPLVLENHYFDITECVNVLATEIQENDNEVKKMKLFLDSMLKN